MLWLEATTEMNFNVAFLIARLSAVRFVRTAEATS